MYNQSTWARAQADASRYLSDAVGHDGPRTEAGRSCISLAITHLGMAERAAGTPDEAAVTAHLADAIRAIAPKLTVLSDKGIGG